MDLTNKKSKKTCKILQKDVSQILNRQKCYKTKVFFQSIIVPQKNSLIRNKRFVLYKKSKRFSDRNMLLGFFIV